MNAGALRRERVGDSDAIPLVVITRTTFPEPGFFAVLVYQLRVNHGQVYRAGTKIVWVDWDAGLISFLMNLSFPSQDIFIM